jgi:hypothetical protein
LSVLEINPSYYRKLFAQWTSNHASLPEFPEDPKQRLVALHFVMMAFEEGIDYSEEDLNQGIRDRNLFATDHVQIRLSLINSGFLIQIKGNLSDSYRPSRLYLNKANWDPSIPGIS